MLGMSGLLNLLTWVEQRTAAQASPQEEGGVPCPISKSSGFPPARFQGRQRSVGRSAPGQSEAVTPTPELSARTPVGAEPHHKRGGRG
jgi:hypothetical protein